MKLDLEKAGEWGFAADGILNSNFQCLCHVIISQLPKLLHLTCLIYIPSLEFLGVTKCESMEELIGEEDSKGVILDDLPNLRSISEQALPFPSLTEIAVYNCPKLRKLPLDSNSATNSLKKIKGESSWWEELQWKDETLKSTFTPYFDS
ncbi:hypothetical protein PVL29_011379 [Vitis rotundifolia]|uniref:Disease resistance protein n=1 Tax=Vitis rotundifolia TaxID=103349 RepID=A0AA38ZPB1_VITRO|nr:hypothetical protein PVL29_011379 [Vitis rotundifolia]